MNPDFRDMLSALFEEEVEFMVVGAYALAAHGYPRSTGDIDIWVKCTAQNAVKVWRALRRFGAPTFDLTEDDLQTPDIVFQIGVAPNRIDILTTISGVEFDDAWPYHKMVQIGRQEYPVIGKSHLLANKKASGRPKDLADVAWLEGEQST